MAQLAYQADVLGTGCGSSGMFGGIVLASGKRHEQHSRQEARDEDIFHKMLMLN